jgi:Na+/phosphate symporter
MTPKQRDRIEHIFKYMEYDHISDAQHDLVISFESQFKERGSLSDRQFEVLENIFKQAAEKA